MPGRSLATQRSSPRLSKVSVARFECTTLTSNIVSHLSQLAGCWMLEVSLWLVGPSLVASESALVETSPIPSSKPQAGFG